MAVQVCLSKAHDPFRLRSWGHGMRPLRKASVLSTNWHGTTRTSSDASSAGKSKSRQTDHRFMRLGVIHASARASTAPCSFASISSPPATQCSSDHSCPPPAQTPASSRLFPPPDSSLRLVTDGLSSTFAFPQQDAGQNVQPSRKRRRFATDVDGPNTAALCCKKRRLRKYLITSRLSQPYSQPATHILNRESVASGDKRFLKLAAIINARRIMQLPVPLPPSPLSSTPSSRSSTSSCLTPPSSPPTTPAAPSRTVAVALVPVPRPTQASELLRRFAMGNNFRIKASMSRESSVAADRKMDLVQSPVQSPVQPPSVGRLPSELVSAPASASATAAFFTSPHPPLPRPSTRLKVSTSGVCSDTVPPSPSPCFSTGPDRPGDLTQLACEAAGLVHEDEENAIYKNDRERPATAATTTKLTEEALSPLQAETSLKGYEDSDDCESAFPGSQSESRYSSNDDPDPDEIYSDFSVLFRPSADDSDYEDGFDDYMDELDGIAHLPR